MFKKNILANFFLFFISIFVIIILLEILLRVIGFKPFIVYKIDLNEPTINKYDPKLGWKPMEGVYIFPPKFENGNNTTLTILKDGSRFSGKPISSGKEEMVFIGGSFTQGVSVSDDETFSFFLQKKTPNLKIKNYGVAGYGTYQSYLLLEELIKNKNNIQYIIYFFFDHHEIRNIGDANWLTILNKFSRRGHAYLPYVRLDKNGNLKGYPPIKYIELPFRKYSSLIAYIEKKIMIIKFYSRYKDKRKITQKIILKMKKISEENGSKFLFINLHSNRDILNKYVNFSVEKKITFINCDYGLKKGFVVENDGHPNHKLHKLYSECIYKYVFN